MANLQDIALSAYINITSVLAFLLAFAFLRLLPINNRVYFAKWYTKGETEEPQDTVISTYKYVNVDWRTCFMFWKWMQVALRMTEAELIEHAGLDSIVYIRIYRTGLKIFVPISILGIVVLVPVNWTGETLDSISDLTFSNIDKLSLSNVPSASLRLVAHIMMAYVVTLWTCYVLYKEYEIITGMRLRFLASEKRRPDQFTVLVRNIPPDPDESITEHVEHFFSENHPEHYLTHQVVYDAKRLAKLVKEMDKWKNWLTYYEKRFERNPERRPRTKTGWLGICGMSVDAIDYHKGVIHKIMQEEKVEKERIMYNPNAIVPSAFVSFKSRWGAAVCAQTQQTSNPMVWQTEWAPEPRDVYWDNLVIQQSQFAVKKLMVAASMFLLTFFFMIPIAFVQSLASIDGMQKVLVFLKPLIRRRRLKSVIQGVLPGVALKIFMILLPTILETMSKVEGHISLSVLERKTAGKYHFFVLVNVFFGSIITGTAFQQLDKFLYQPPSGIPRTLGVGIPMKATFFITYIMVDGWASVAAEIVRVVPLIKFYVKSTFLALTELDLEEAANPASLNFAINEPRIQLYFLLGLVYSAVTPLILPFIVVFFAFAYLIYRHQIINVYEQKYESGARFWPHVHRRIIISLILSQVLLMGLLSTKKAAKSTPLLLALTFFTIWFHFLCKGRFEPAFVKFPIQEAMVKDTRERTNEPNLNLKAYLADAYIHPALKGMEIEKPKAINEEEVNPLVPPNGRYLHKNEESDSGGVRSDVMDELFTYL
ncbi:hypothetical protein ACS0TY_013019 [Phlomoides rotata]